MRYWAINRKTKQRYGPYTEAEKTDFQSTPSTDVYDWEEIPTPKTATAPTGVKAATKDKETKAKPERRTKTRR